MELQNIISNPNLKEEFKAFAQKYDSLQMVILYEKIQEYNELKEKENEQEKAQEIYDYVLTLHLKHPNFNSNNSDTLNGKSIQDINALLNDDLNEIAKKFVQSSKTLKMERKTSMRKDKDFSASLLSFLQNVFRRGSISKEERSSKESSPKQTSPTTKIEVPKIVVDRMVDAKEAKMKYNTITSIKLGMEKEDCTIPYCLSEYSIDSLNFDDSTENNTTFEGDSFIDHPQILNFMNRKNSMSCDDINFKSKLTNKM
eukprot:gene9760-2087_t